MLISSLIYWILGITGLLGSAIAWDDLAPARRQARENDETDNIEGQASH